MKLISEPGGGILLLQTPLFCDSRGQFIKLADHGLQDFRPFEQRQLNYVTNTKRFTFRGLHYQKGDYSESKIFRVITGSAIIIAFDVRSTSATFQKTFSMKLFKPEIAVWVPRGFATGYCTLEDGTSVLYSSDNDYHPEAESGIRWNDPRMVFTDQPAAELIVSEKDMNWPDFE